MNRSSPAVPIGTKELRAIDDAYQRLETPCLVEPVARSILMDLFETAWRWGREERAIADAVRDREGLRQYIASRCEGLGEDQYENGKRMAYTDILTILEPGGWHRAVTGARTILDGTSSCRWCGALTLSERTDDHKQWHLGIRGDGDPV